MWLAAASRRPATSLLPTRGGQWFPASSSWRLNPALDQCFSVIFKTSTKHGMPKEARCQLGFRAGLILLQKAREKQVATTLKISRTCQRQTRSSPPSPRLFFPLALSLDWGYNKNRETNTKVKSARCRFGHNTLRSCQFRFQRVCVC